MGSLGGRSGGFMDATSGGQSGHNGSLARHEVKYVALLGLTEIGVGSVIHGLKIPLGGHCLSLNQGLILMQSSRFLDDSIGRFQKARSASHISLMTALMKSFSPAGKKLTPMLAIMVQGILFSIGVVTGGANLIGFAMGMVLLSIWGFAQPILLAWLFVGAHFWEATEILWLKLAEPFGLQEYSVLNVLLLFVLTKALLAVGLVFLSQAFVEKWSGLLSRKGEEVLRFKKIRSPTKTEDKSIFLSLLRDLISPLVLTSVILSLVFAYYSQKTSGDLVWAFLRPLAAAFVGFYIIRMFPAEKLVQLFAKNNPNRADLIRKVAQSLDDFAR